MAAPTIEIIIAARANQFEAEIQRLEKRIAGLEGSLGRGLGRGTKNFTKNTNQAQNALRDFSRVVQDAPFGIIGVGNNIQELAGSFGFLVRSSGGVGAAIRGVIGALSGPGGLILAVSAITTGLTIFAKRSQGAKAEVNKLKDSFESLLAIGNLDIRIAEFGGNRQAIDEARKAQIGLIQTAQTRLSRELDILRVQLAQAKAAREQKTVIGGIVTLLERAFLLTLGSIGVSIDGIGDAFEKVIEEIKKSAQPLGLFLIGLEKSADALRDLDETPAQGPGKEEIDAQNTLNELIQKQKGFELEVLQLQKKRAEAQAQETGLANTLEGILAGILDGGPIDFANGIIDKFRVLSDALKVGAKDLATNLRTSFEEIPNAIASNLQSGLERLILFGQRLQDGGLFIAGAISNVVDTINNSLGPAIANFGEILGRQLQQGVAFSKALGNALLGGLSTIANSVADELIRLGALTIAIGKVQTVLENITPGPGKIVAGLAAIALGTALKGISAAARGASLATTGGGGIATSTGQGSVGGPEFASDVGDQQVVFEIEGQTLVGVLNNTLGRRRRVSGRVI